MAMFDMETLIVVLILIFPSKNEDIRIRNLIQVPGYAKISKAFKKPIVINIHMTPWGDGLKL